MEGEHLDILLLMIMEPDEELPISVSWVVIGIIVLDFSPEF
jgi:hypothetical protein